MSEQTQTPFYDWLRAQKDNQDASPWVKSLNQLVDDSLEAIQKLGHENVFGKVEVGLIKIKTMQDVREAELTGNICCSEHARDLHWAFGEYGEAVGLRPTRYTSVALLKKMDELAAKLGLSPDLGDPDRQLVRAVFSGMIQGGAAVAQMAAPKLLPSGTTPVKVSRLMAIAAALLLCYCDGVAEATEKDEELEPIRRDA